METAFAYARVSTKQQMDRDNSIPAQFDRIEEFCNKEGIVIVKKFFDSESAFHDEKRDKFKRMVDESLKEYPTYIITDDSSRFARTKSVAVAVKQKLRKNGIEILFANETNLDPDSIAGLWNEGIQEMMNQTYSMQNSFHVKKGMNYNIQNRDPDTGWCYKNGGIPAFGYEVINISKGRDSKGKPILKMIWGIHEERAPIVREILIDMYLEKDMTYSKIRDELNSRHIKTRNDGLWSVSSIAEMVKPHRLKGYAGIHTWNRKYKGNATKLKKSDNKVMEIENAHPAIITMGELEVLLNKRKAVKRSERSRNSYRSNFLFTGPNIQGEKMFICKNCGSSFVAHQNGKTNYQKYACGGFRSKGRSFCTNDVKIDRKWLEDSVVSEIEKIYSNIHKIDSMIKTINSNLQKELFESEKEIKKNVTDIKKYKLEMDRMITALKNGLSSSIAYKEINELELVIKNLTDRNEELQNSSSERRVLNEDKIRFILSNFREVFNKSDYNEKRQLVRTFVKCLEYDAEIKKIDVFFFNDYTVQTVHSAWAHHI